MESYRFVRKNLLGRTPEEYIVLKPCDRKENDTGWKVVNKEPEESKE